MRLPNCRGFSLVAAPLTALVLLQACDSSSSSNEDTSAPSLLTARAVDGYLVGANVYCDEIAVGGTSAGGLLSCPEDTTLVRVAGGSDVGFDLDATSGGEAFAGELVSPMHTGWVTPLSTIAVALSSEDGVFQPERFESGTDVLARSLGQSDLDLSAPADSLVQLIRMNAQIHQILSVFAVDADDYRVAVQALATVLQDRESAGLVASLGDDAGDLIREMNQELERESSDLALDEISLEQQVLGVTAINQTIEGQSDRDEIAETANTSLLAAASLTLNRDRVNVRVGFGLQSCSVFAGDCPSFSLATRDVSLEDFESSETTNGYYRTLLSAFFSTLTFDQRILTVNRDLDDVRISLGVEVVSTDPGDLRTLAFVTDQARLSAQQNDVGTLEWTIPSDAVIHARTRTTDGANTQVSMVLDGGASGGIDGQSTLDIESIRRGMTDRGLSDVLRGEGNYEVTVSIGGVRINAREGSEVVETDTFVIEAGDLRVAGPGLRGYVSIFKN